MNKRKSRKPDYIKVCGTFSSLVTRTGYRLPKGEALGRKPDKNARFFFPPPGLPGRSAKRIINEKSPPFGGLFSLVTRTGIEPMLPP